MNRGFVCLAASVALPFSASPVAGKDRSRPAQPVGSPAEWFVPDNYPVEAIRAWEEGRTVARVEIAANGVVTGCTIEQTSGSRSLDEGTCALVRAKGRFNSALSTRGKPTASTYTLPVRWVLPPGEPLDLTGGRKRLAEFVIEISIDENGIATGCKAVEVAEGPDPCASYKLGKRAPDSAAVNGKPVQATVTIKGLTYIDPK